MKTLCVILSGFLVATPFISGQSVPLNPKGTFASAAVELNGLSGPTVDSGTEYDLYMANYGSISTGNTLSRCEFIATMEAAYAGSFGGVYGFDLDPEVLPVECTEVNLLNEGGTPLASFVPGLDNYVEGGNNEIDQYRGKETPYFDGTGPSPLSVKDPPLIPPMPFSIGTSSSKAFIGTAFLLGTTSFDLDFDIVDEVSVIGFALLNYNNFQSYQRGNRDYPNVHARAVWSNGVDEVTQMAVQYSRQIPDGNDTFFGFKQPAPGYFLDALRYYVIGNAARAWIGIDELGIAIGDGVAMELDTPATQMPDSGQVTIAVQQDCMYQLQTSADLTTWTDEGDPVYPASDGDQSWSTPPPSAGEKAFYRVQVP